MWVADHTVKHCKCGKNFSLLTRRHHCRKCGHIFCDQCTGLRAAIPSFTGPQWEGQKRVCNPCYQSIRVIESVEYIMRVFALMPFKMPPICKKWATAIDALDDVTRKIPQKMLHVKYSRLERSLLKTRSGTGAVAHCVAWGIRRLCILGLYSDIDVSCSDMVQILNSHYGVHILRMHRPWVLRCFESFSTADIIRFIPWWLQTSLVEDIMDRATDIRFAYAIYFECAARADEKSQTILRSLMKIPHEIRMEIKATNNMIKAVELNIIRRTNIIPAKLPYNTDVTVYSVSKVVRMGSASKPYAVTLETSAGPLDILVKNTDLRKDKCTMVICQLLHELCGIRCLSYPVFVTRRGGWIQMLESKTLYELSNNLSTHVYNQYPETPPRITREKFRKSVVGSCILSYVIGLGDRHLQNIVVCNGELAHIDFSYMFGHDPKIPQPLRVTAPTIQMMGGKESPGYRLFLEEVEEAFTIVQRHSSLWCILMENLAHTDLYTLAEIRKHANLIGSPGIEVVDIVKNHSDTWLHTFGDVVHGIFQFKF